MLNTSPPDPEAESGAEPAGDPGLPPPALCEGSPLLTTAGELPVEQLAPGAELVLAGGGHAKLRWLGRRAVLPGAMSAAHRAAWQPVRIRRGAIAPGLPSRDLLVSPSLGLRLNGVLVAAAALVDGEAILIEPSDAPVRYIQPEIGQHAALLAAGLEVESYADRGDRNSFANAVDAPDAAGPSPAMPRARAGTAADCRAAAHDAVARRTTFAGSGHPRSPELRLLVDGQVLAPVSVEDGLHRFRLAGPGREIRLLSRTLVPALQTAGSFDQRRLGVSLRWMRLRSHDAVVELRHDHPAFTEGFHEVEDGARWTDGFALLPPRLYRFLFGEITAEVMIGSPDVTYPVPAEERRPRALVIDETVPMPDRDAGSNVMIAHMRLLQSLGYAVTFLPANLAAPAPYAQTLAEAGIELASHPYCAGLEHLLGLRGRSFALAYVHRVSIAERAIPLLRRGAPQARILFNNADLHFLRLQREAELTGAAALRQEAEQVRQRELQAFAAADVGLVCNAQEVELVHENVPQARLVYLPWVIGPREVGAAGFAERHGIMFLGGFAHRPNPDAVIWFVTEVMPLLRPLLPGVVLHVYGHGIPDSLHELAGQDVAIEGHAADLARVFARHRLSVAPLRFGAGFKGKLAESLAHGVPAVASSIAAEGTGLLDGEHLLLADGAEPFARAVALLYQTPALWQALASQGLQFVDTHFSEAAGQDRLREALRLAGMAEPG